MTPTISHIQRVVSADAKIPLSVMTSADRRRNAAHPRQVAMYLSRTLTGSSWARIAERFGQRDHTTVIHAYKVVKSNPELFAAAQRCQAALKAVPRNWKDRVSLEIRACTAIAEALSGLQTKGARLASGPQVVGSGGAPSGEGDGNLIGSPGP